MAEAQARGRAWWHYALAVAGVLALAGLVWGGSAIWFTVTHVRATYARVSGLIVTVSAKGDTRVQRLLVSIGDPVKAGQQLVLLDNADLVAEVAKAEAVVRSQESARERAKADWDMTIRQTSAGEQQAAAELAAAQARLAQAQAESRLQAQQAPEDVRAADARLKSAKADLRRLEAGARPQEVEQARAEVTAARARLSNATSALARMQKLHGQGAVSAQSLEEADTTKQVAEASLRSAQERLSLLLAGTRQEDLERARQEVDWAEAALSTARARTFEGQMKTQGVATRTAEVRQADAAVAAAQSNRSVIALKAQDYAAQIAAVEQAKAALEQARVRLSESSLRSPVNGIVLRGIGAAVHEGEVVTKGAPIVTIVCTDSRPGSQGSPYWITGAVSELYAARVHKDQPVTIVMEAFRGREFHGTVEQVGGATEVSSGDAANQWMLQQVPIRVSFDPKGAPVKPGMSCQAWIDVRK